MDDKNKFFDGRNDVKVKDSVEGARFGRITNRDSVIDKKDEGEDLENDLKKSGDGILKKIIGLNNVQKTFTLLFII